jgi:hypothetical protein
MSGIRNTVGRTQGPSQPAPLEELREKAADAGSTLLPADQDQGGEQRAKEDECADRQVDPEARKEPAAADGACHPEWHGQSDHEKEEPSW